MKYTHDRLEQAPKFWWKKEFGSTYFHLYNPILSGKRAAHEAEFIINSIPLSHGMNILDLGCGHGRHTLELAQKQYKVIGLDYSDYFLKIAKNNAKKQGIPIQFIKQDMRSLDIHTTYDAIISMYSAFGYFPHDENVDVLRRVYDALKPGGKFMIDVINAHSHVSYIRTHGKKLKNGVYKLISHNAIDGYKLEDTNLYFEKTQLDSYHRTWTKNTQKGSFNYYMYQYTLKQYKEMLESVGFCLENLWGDYNNARWNINSWRTILLCSKPNHYPIHMGSIKNFINFTLLNRWPKT